MKFKSEVIQNILMAIMILQKMLTEVDVDIGSNDCVQSTLWHVFSHFTHYLPSEGYHTNMHHCWT
jgi:hypothetical protein